jgi:hypothetical protein
LLYLILWTFFVIFNDFISLFASKTAHNAFSSFFFPIVSSVSRENQRTIVLLQGPAGSGRHRWIFGRDIAPRTPGNANHTRCGAH